MGYKRYSNINCLNRRCYGKKTFIIRFLLLRDLLNIKHHAPLKSMYSKHQIIKYWKIIFKLLFLDQANSSSYPSQILILQFPTNLISSFYLEVWAVTTRLTISDSSSPRLRKLIHCGCGKPSSSPSFIPSTYFYYFHTLLIPLKELTFPWKPVS